MWNDEWRVELKIKLHVNFFVNNTMYKQQNLIMTIGELKFIFRMDKGSSATEIISEKRERISPTLPFTNWKKKKLFLMGGVSLGIIIFVSLREC